MSRTPYSPFVEKDTAPVLWYVLVASLLLLRCGRSVGRGAPLIPTKTIGNEYINSPATVNEGTGRCRNAGGAFGGPQ
jgi:hypothetical protein